MASTTRIANETWEALFRAQATVARELTDGDVWGDLVPPEYGVLYALSTAPDGLRISELGADVLLTQPGMSRLIARLEARGLVARRRPRRPRLPHSSTDAAAHAARGRDHARAPPPPPR
jgi:DNA-binding MarR family transcriptional regulator